MRPRRVALIVDNPYRDLPGMVLVAVRLCAAGATCYLVPLNLEWLEVSALAPDFVLLTNLRGPRQPFARRLLDAGIKVGVLDSEGGVFSSLEAYGRMASPSADVYKRVSCFCSWGPKLAGYVSDRGWYRPEQVAVTGPPRFDFYSRRWREVALRTSAEIDEYKRPIILVNGSFPRANPAFQTPEQERASWAALGFAEDYMLEYQAVEGRALRELAAVANHVARRFPHALVVYRPHPFERMATYEELLERLDNLCLLRIGTVEGWILRASVVIHRNSTTAVEATLAGVPVLLPQWIPVGEVFPAVETVSTPCVSLDDLDARIAVCLAGGEPAAVEYAAVRTDVVREWFHLVDGSAHERVAAAILPHLSDGDIRTRQAGCRDLHYEWGPPNRPLRSRFGSVVRKQLGLPAAWSFRECRERDPGARWLESVKRFDVTDVSRIASAVRSDSAGLAIDEARVERDYRFGYQWGHSVVLRQEDSAA